MSEMRLEGSFRKLKPGYGFIAGRDGIDYFFHQTDMSKWTKQFRYCAEGEQVTFVPSVTTRGPRALSIEVVGHTIHPPIPASQ